jgi:hypothetical protein
MLKIIHAHDENHHVNNDKSVVDKGIMDGWGGVAKRDHKEYDYHRCCEMQSAIDVSVRKRDVRMSMSRVLSVFLSLLTANTIYCGSDIFQYTL